MQKGPRFKGKEAIGELVVIGGTNEIAIVTREPAEGFHLFSDRLKNGTMGSIAIVGKLPDHLAEFYWRHHR